MSESELPLGDPTGDLSAVNEPSGGDPTDGESGGAADLVAASIAPAAAVDGEAEPAEEADPIQEFKAELRMLPGDWYVVHSYAGYENRVRTNLESRTQSLNMEDFIFQIEVPTHEVMEIKSGKRQQVQEKVLPGYILVRMDLTDESWAAVRNTPGVTGFVGLSSRPSPLSLEEVAKLLAPVPEEKVAETAQQAAPGRGRRLRDRAVGYRHGRAVCDTASDGQRDQRRYPEAQGAGLDLRPGDAR